MQTGDVARLRSLRTFGRDGRSWMEFKADDAVAVKDDGKKEKKVFLALIIGTERLIIPEGEGLDVKKVINCLGYWGVDQMVEALGPAEFERINEMLVQHVFEKQEEENQDG